MIPECGDILKGGIVCYDACIKQDVLGVRNDLVELMQADIQVAVTGLTMPGGSETKEKLLSACLYML